MVSKEAACIMGVGVGAENHAGEVTAEVMGMRILRNEPWFVLRFVVAIVDKTGSPSAGLPVLGSFEVSDPAGYW